MTLIDKDNKDKMLETLEAIRKKLMERFELTSHMRGEWNDGYTEAIQYAMSLLHDEIRRDDKIIQPKLFEHNLNTILNKKEINR